MKKIISFCLSVCMIIAVSVQAFAQEYYVEEKHYNGTPEALINPLTLYDSATETRRKNIFQPARCRATIHLGKNAKKRMRFENQSDIVELQHKTNGKEAQIS